MGRSHDYYCPDCKCWWSPLTFARCPEDHEVDRSFYDLNHEAEESEEEGFEDDDENKAT